MLAIKKKNRPLIGLYCTRRDYQVLKTLRRYQIIRESTLHQLCFPSVKHQRHVQGSLKRLVDEEYIGRRFPPIRHPNNETFRDFYRQDGQQNAIYFLTPKGAARLWPEEIPVQELQYIKTLSTAALTYLQHRLDVADIQACVEIALRQQGTIGLAAWFHEHDRDEHGAFRLHDRVVILDEKGQKERRLPIRPDACFVLEERTSGRQELFFVEMDEGTESLRRRWKDKVLSYRPYYGQGFQDRYQFHGDGFRVLVICRSLSGKEQAKRKASLLKTTAELGGGGMFWFTTFAEIMPQSVTSGVHFLSSPIWQRASLNDKDTQRQRALASALF